MALALPMARLGRGRTIPFNRTRPACAPFGATTACSQDLMPTHQTLPLPFDPEETLPGTPPPKSLVRVLDRSEHIKQAVEECVEELSSVNSALKGELSNGLSRTVLSQVLQRAETVKAKVQECANELMTVTEALEVQLEERTVLDDEVIAARKEAVLARHAAFHDPLTSLANRAMFDDRLAHALAQAKRHGRKLAVLFIDLDDFKSVNDTHGHAAGDGVLRQVAQRLTAMSRDADTVSRRGGDEFLYLLTELADENDAAAVAEKVVRVLSAHCQVGSPEMQEQKVVCPSVGIALFPKDGTTAAALLEKADEAMYRAKRSGVGFAFAS
jgi:diguanylate cyclase (GGDEF)-like protein